MALIIAATDWLLISAIVGGSSLPFSRALGGNATTKSRSGGPTFQFPTHFNTPTHFSIREILAARNQRIPIVIVHPKGRDPAQAPDPMATERNEHVVSKAQSLESRTSPAPAVIELGSSFEAIPASCSPAHCSTLVDVPPKSHSGVLVFHTVDLPESHYSSRWLTNLMSLEHPNGCDSALPDSVTPSGEAELPVRIAQPGDIRPKTCLFLSGVDVVGEDAECCQAATT